MKRLYIIWLLLSALALSGCAKSYREIARLEVVSALAFDLDEDGRQVLTVATSKRGDAPGAKLGVSSDSLSGALSGVQQLAIRDQIFYSDTGYVLLGESAAADALPYLDFITRSIEVRLDTPLFIVRGDSAGELVKEAGGDNADVSEVLKSLSEGLRYRGYPQPQTCGDAVERFLRDGASLCRSIERVETETGVTAVTGGYAILREGRLAGWLESEAALGADMLSEGAGRAQVALSDGVVAELIKAKADMAPVWTDEGLERLVFSCSLEAAVVEDASLDLTDDGVRKRLEAELARFAESCLDGALSELRRLGADFLSLGARLEARWPTRFRSLETPWEETLRSLDYDIVVEAALSRAFILEKPLEGGRPVE